MRRGASGTRVTWVVVSGLVALILTATGLAATTLSRPFPSLFVDPFGTFSVVYLPSWDTESLDLRYPDRLVAVGDRRVTGTLRHDALATASPEGRAVALTFLTEEGEREVRAAVRRIGAVELFCFFALYALVGLALASLGLAAFISAPDEAVTRAFLVPTVSSAVFFVAFYDYHTTAVLVPLFSAATVVTPAALLWLALSFPHPPRWLRARPRVAPTYAAVVACAALAMAVAPALGIDAEAGRRIVSVATPCSLVFLAACIVVRRRYSRGRERVELNAVMVGLGLVPFLVGLAFVPTVFLDTSAVLHLMLPIVGLAIPASMGIAIARHNALRTRDLLGRQAIRASLAFLSLAVGGGGGVLLLLVSGNGSLLASIAGGGLLTVIVFVAAARGVERWVFPAERQFRPTIEQLADVVTSIRSRDGVMQAVEEHVRSWLPALRVEVVVPEDLPAICTSEGLARLRAGEVEWTPGNAVERALAVPMRSRGELHGALFVDQKEGGALYTTDDVALLSTIASIGAVALHGAAMFEELERQSALAGAAALEDKRQTVDLLAAEVSHELRYPINYFRHLLRQASRGEELLGEDLEVGAEELDRMERMLSALARVKRPAPRRAPVRLSEVATRALALLDADAEEAEVSVEVDGSRDAVVAGDPDALLQMCANLVRNAIQHAGRGGRVEVVVRRDGGEAILRVSDTGPGVSEEIGDGVFDPWVSARAGGQGLGLAVAMRIARSFAGSLIVDSGGGGSAFVARFPARAAAEPEGGAD